MDPTPNTAQNLATVEQLVVQVVEMVHHVVVDVHLVLWSPDPKP